MSQQDAVACWLTGPLGTVHVTKAGMSQTVNGGVQWRATVASLLEYAWGENDVWQLHVRTARGISYDSMGLQLVTAVLGTGTDGNTSELAGVSTADFCLNTEGISHATYQNTPVLTLIQNLVGLVGLGAGGVSQDFGNVQEFDVQGGTVRSYLERICKDYGLTFRVGATGDVELLWPGEPENLSSVPLTRKITTNLDESGRWHQLVMKKTSKASGEYRFQFDKYGYFEGDVSGGLVASTMQFHDLSTVGGIGYLCGWDQPSHAGGLSFFFANSHYGNYAPQIPFGQNVVRSITGSLDPGSMGTSLQAHGEVVLRGIPPGTEGYEHTFQVRYPNVTPPTGTKVRWRVQTLESPMWQDHGVAEACDQFILWEMNKGVHVKSRDTDFDPHVKPGQWYDSVRYDSVDWAVDNGSITQKMNGWVPVG